MHILLNLLSPIVDFLLKAAGYIWVFKAGKDKQKLKQAEKENADARKAKEISEGIGAMSPSDVKRQLRKYKRK